MHEKSERFDDAVAALVTLGYTSTQAQTAVRRVSEEAGDAAAEELLKRALALLARPSLVTR
jgi:Holliday junction resolvasome RuvABC DNA-binding subunit